MENLLDKAREEINEADRAIAAAFERRMTAVRSVAQYKRKTGKPIFDPAREAQVIERGTALISDEELRPYYAALLADMMRVSREYQHRALAVSDTIRVGTASGGYDIILRRGALREVGSLLKLDRKVMIVTDDGVPAEYTRAVAEASRTPTVLCLPHGEDSKRIPVWQSVLSKMLESGFTRQRAALLPSAEELSSRPFRLCSVGLHARHRFLQYPDYPALADRFGHGRQDRR